MKEKVKSTMGFTARELNLELETGSERFHEEVIISGGMGSFLGAGVYIYKGPEAVAKVLDCRVRIRGENLLQRQTEHCLERQKQFWTFFREVAIALRIIFLIFILR